MEHGLIEKHSDATAVAAVAASDAIARLQTAIAERGQAVWVLAGGSSPMAAYRLIAEQYADQVDWAQVTVLIGDERMVPITDADSNLGTIAEVLFEHPAMRVITALWPSVDAPAEEAALQYEAALRALPADVAGAPIIDLVWLGVGEDGHTLSLFPGHPDFVPTADLVIAVHNSPKPPPTRITLTRAALDGARRVVIFATGAGKKDALAKALATGELPIAQVAQHAARAGAEVTWLFDEAAAS